MTAPTIPYCGAPPLPDSLLSRWNLDPVLIACLVAVTCGYALAVRGRPAPAGTGARRLFHAGWALTALALVSPICPLSVSLFSARVGQHMILTLIAAPMVAAGLPAAGGGRLDRILHGKPLMAAAAFAVLLWFWHSPTPYAETFRRTDVYWAMHLTLYGSAVWLWAALLRPAAGAGPGALAAGAISSLQMGFLGAILTLAPHVLFSPHLATAGAWGLTPLEDQQFGGALMWGPGCLAFFAAAAAGLWRLLSSRRGDPGQGRACVPAGA